jgi:hypothetical protein
MYIPAIGDGAVHADILIRILDDGPQDGFVGSEIPLCAGNGAAAGSGIGAVDGRVAESDLFA